MKKPPYRRFYFIHQIAYAGDQKIFDDFNRKYQLDLNLLTNDDKSIVDVANDARHGDFAKYVNGLIEKNQPEKSSDQFSRESRLLKRAHVRDYITASTPIALTESNLTHFLTCPLSGTLLKVLGRNDRISCIKACKTTDFL